jgi:parallel beta-helix repeat protein
MRKHGKSATVVAEFVMLRAILIVCVLAVPAAASGATYYVETTGSDAGPGTLTQPWATVQKAADTMIAGDTVLIRGGVYFEMVIPQNAGGAGAEITYSGFPGETAVIDGTGGGGACFYLPPSLSLHHLVFKDLTLRNAPSANFWAEASPGVKHDLTLDGLNVESTYLGVFLRKGVTDSRIVNCDMFGSQYNIYLDRSNADILIEGNELHDTQFVMPGDIFSQQINLYGQIGEKNKRITIINNHVHHAVQQGIEVFHARDVIVRGNYCHDNGATGIQIESDPSLGPSLRVVVEDNLCENNSRLYQAETGMWIDDTDGVIVQNNVIRGNEIGLQITGCNGVIARFNTIHENYRLPFINSGGIKLRSSDQSAATADDVVVHNTLHRNGLSSQRADVQLGDLPTQLPVDRIVFKNNVASRPLSARVLWIRGSGYEVDYNAYFPLPGTSSVAYQGFQMGWNTYLGQSGFDTNSIYDNPGFEDAPGWDFRIRHTSPCVDAGDFLTRTTAAGRGITVPVADARYFSDGMGLVFGDRVQVGANEVAVVVGVDTVSGTINVDRLLTWNAGDGVSYPYEGAAPDIGAYEVPQPLVHTEPYLPVK